MGDLALLQSLVQVNDTWLDYFIIGVYFVFVLGIGAVLRNKMQTSSNSTATTSLVPFPTPRLQASRR